MRLAPNTTFAIAAIVLLSSSGAPGQESIKPLVHTLFSDHMVLQRGKEVPIWGWAKPGTQITVAFGSVTIEVKADNSGKWTAKLGPLEANSIGKTLTVNGGARQQFEDVLVGDVWICSGQSNMEWPVAASNNAQAEIENGNHPDIRLFTVPKQISTSPQELVHGTWSVCTPQSVPKFSAVGYFFGRELNSELKIPIGLIHTSWGGTVAEAWTSSEALRELGDFDEAIDGLDRTAKELQDPNKVTVLYNGMFAPLKPFGITGAIWYQGESNADRAAQYRRLLPIMIKDWRNSLGQGDFPFLIVQLANFMQQQIEPVQSGWAELREAQQLTADRDSNVGLAVITDLGEANDIHPRNKQDVGKRLALQALEIAYGKVGVHCGPTIKDMGILGDSVVIDFDNVGSGLVAKGRELTGFAIAEQQGDFVWAEGEIRGDSVVLWNEELAEPIRVRYNWGNNPIGNLFNKEGLPAAPFRTDRR